MIVASKNFIMSSDMHSFICDGCGSTEIFGNESGIYVCHNCGLCFDDPVVNPTQGCLMKNREGQLIHQNSIKLGAGTLVGMRGERKTPSHRRMSKLQSICNSHPNDTAFGYINQLCTEFDIPTDSSKILCLFKKIYPVLPASTKSRNIQYLSTVISIIIFKNSGIDYDFKKILEWGNLKLQDYFQIMRSIHRAFPEFDKLDIKTLEDNACKLLHRIKVNYNLTFETFSMAKRLVSRFRSYLGNKLRIIAGTAIAVAMEIHCQNNISIFRDTGID